MVRRVCRELRNKKNIIVINDEAHHCYRRKPDGIDENLKSDERVEAKQRAEEARVWISGIEAVKAKLGIKAIYDLSATPFFLRGSGYSEGTLFPWVVSDFSLIDAIEAGIVKVPRVPVSDDSMTGEPPFIGDNIIAQAGQLPIFRNDDGHGNWLQRPNTILVDSQQLESGEAMSADFKKIASVEIEEFESEYRLRIPGRDTDNLTDEDCFAKS